MTDALARKIERDFEAAMEHCGPLREEVLREVQTCGGDERLYLQYLYSAMPLSDLAEYPPALFRAFVSHALRLRAESAWDIPEDLFLAYVLHYRVNNENIEDCRGVFYEELRRRVSGLTMEQAALEVNYWCQEHVIYQSTDGRTASPLTVLRRTFGRCGEESTFAVTALRSIGLPARQVYAPRWAHCDDNHAWVEVWCDGRWHYMGACEPEEVLDKGWFNAASSRAMVVHSRLFSALPEGEPPFAREGKAWALNQVERYNPQTRELVIHCGAPDVEVRCEVLNYAELAPVASVRSGKDGCARVRLGLGGVHLHAVRGGQVASLVVDTGRTGEVALDFEQPARAWEELTLAAPRDNLRPAPAVTAEQAVRQRERFANGLAARAQTLAAFPQENDLVRAAMGNHREVALFLERGGLRERLLRTLAEKDLADCRADVLEEHLRYAEPYEGRFDAAVFDRYLLCPRIHLEMITPYRGAVDAGLTQEEKERYRNDPEALWAWVDAMEETGGMEYGQLITTPAGMLRARSGSRLSRRVLFVAVCRTLGVPARISPETQHAEYYRDGSFADVEYAARVRLRLTAGEGMTWTYGQNWSLAVLDGGVYQTLNLREVQWQGPSLELDLCPGDYRVITCSRMPNGGVVANLYRLRLDTDRTLAVAPPEADLLGMLEQIPLPDIALRDAAGAQAAARELIAGRKSLLLWLAEGEEPTEHILNELLELKDRYARLGDRILFLLRGPEALGNATLARVLREIPGIRVWYSDFAMQLEPVARRMYVEPGKLPLVVAADGDGNGLYACCGYNVGVVELLLRILQ